MPLIITIAAFNIYIYYNVFSEFYFIPVAVEHLYVPKRYPFFNIKFTATYLCYCSATKIDGSFQGSGSIWLWKCCMEREDGTMEAEAGQDAPNEE
jgi:hypothetical protein